MNPLTLPTTFFRFAISAMSFFHCSRSAGVCLRSALPQWSRMNRVSGHLSTSLAKSGNSAGPHAQVEAQPEFAEQLNPLHELRVEAVPGRRVLDVQHLPDALHVLVPLELLGVLREAVGVRPARHHRGARRRLAALAQLDDVVRFLLLLLRDDVHFHVHRLHDVQPLRGLGVLLRREAVAEDLAFGRLRVEPRELELVGPTGAGAYRRWGAWVCPSGVLRRAAGVADAASDRGGMRRGIRGGSWTETSWVRGRAADGNTTAAREYNDPMSTPQRILVTGSAGRVGRAAVAELVARGHTVIGFDVRPTPGLPAERVRRRRRSPTSTRCAGPRPGASCDHPPRGDAGRRPLPARHPARRRRQLPLGTGAEQRRRAVSGDGSRAHARRFRG